MSQTLHQQLNQILLREGAPFFKSWLPASISPNLRAGMMLRPYQQEALGRFAWYWQKGLRQEEFSSRQLLFHMATGSGKTLIMAGLMLYLYEQGYRNFIFFVDSTNIIEKTRDNFLNPGSAKYLFADVLHLGGRQIRIREVDNFQGANEDDINLLFATVQGLHSRLNNPKEGALTYEDFEEQKLVLLSDEAHHLNAETKKGKKRAAEEQEREESWEATVSRIFGANDHNLLLEFTATADFGIPEIAQKYSSRLLFDYPLKQFRRDGYSKEVKVLQGSLKPFERALQAVLLSQYRRKLFEQWGLAIKPVVLFKSKTIKESQCNLEAFVSGIKSLKAAELEQLRLTSTEPVIQKMFTYFEEKGIALDNLISELQEDFSEEKLISVNSREDGAEKQLALNSLEEETNPYRAVFAVDKLNEGWDVLNLFDIVRLSDGGVARGGKPQKTTMAEAQLIGRGARYCPFRLNPAQALYRRKWDDDAAHELRICEELYYHSAHHPAYIRELYAALELIGIKDEPGAEGSIALKKAKGVASCRAIPEGVGDEQIMGPKKGAFAGVELPDNLLFGIARRTFRLGRTISETAGAAGSVRTASGEKLIPFRSLGEHLLRKAMHKLPFYQFSNLKKHFPELRSISEFIASEQYLGNIILASEIGETAESLRQQEKLDAALLVLEMISVEISKGKSNIQSQCVAEEVFS